MSLAKDRNIQEDFWEDIVLPPTDIESDEPPLESDLHLRQIVLLIQCLEYLWRDRNDFYATGNLTIYFSPDHIKSRDFRGPDFFVVLGTERKLRKSWVLWAEGGKYPNIIIEILSDSTATVDRGLKKQLYQDIFRTPEYFWFDPATLEFQGFSLISGQYHPLEPNTQGWLWSQQLGLYLGIDSGQLRYITPEGDLVPTPQEAAEQAQEAAEQAQEAAEQAQRQVEAERQQREQLLTKLRERGIDPETL